MAYLQYVSPALMTTAAVASLHLTHFLETLINDRAKEERLDLFMCSQICTSSYNNRKTDTFTKIITFLKMAQLNKKHTLFIVTLSSLSNKWIFFFS